MMKGKWYFILMGFVVSVASAVEVTNPGFETGDYTGWAWTKAATVSSDPNYVHSGIYSSKLDNLAGPYDNISAYMEQYPVGGWNANTITAGDILTLSAWVYNPSEDPLVSGQGGYLRTYVVGDTSGTYAEASDFIIDSDIPQDEWTLVTHTMTVPEGDYYLVGISVMMFEFSALDGGAVYIDDVQLERIMSGSCQAGVYLEGDINKDCYVNFQDFVLLAQNWLQDNYNNLVGNGGI
jgi:hypothetical protein